MSENIRKGGSKTTGQILKEAGYSESVSKSPQRVTESKGWQELMEEYFPSEYLLKKHKKLLNKKEIVTYKGDFKKTRQPHTDVKYALDMLYDICKKHHTELIMLNLQEQPFQALEKYGFIDDLGNENICSNVKQAIERANTLLKIVTIQQ